MITVGIDMSRNSPGVCIRKKNKITFLAFPRCTTKPNSKSHKERDLPYYSILEKNSVSVKVNYRCLPKLEYSDLEMWKLEDSIILSTDIINSLPKKINLIGLEGFSYNSRGNSGLDIAGSAYCLRHLLFNRYGSSKIRVFAPSYIKKYAGKGNASKDQMYNFFINSDDKVLRKNSLWKKLKNNKIENKKPIDDLIDAYYIQECALNHITSQKNI